ADLKLHEPARCLALLLERDLRLTELLVGEGGHLTRHAEHAEEVATMRLDVQIDDGALRGAYLAQGHAQRCIRRQDQDAGVVVAKAELAWRAEHALREHAHRLLLLNYQIADARAESCQRHLVVPLDIRGTADHAELFGARRDTCRAQVV